LYKFYSIYHLLENSILVALSIRILFSFFKKQLFSREHFTVLAFIILLIFNTVLFEISSIVRIPDEYAYYFIHAFAPPIISSLIIWNHWRQLNILLFAAILVGFINYYFKIDEYIVLIYYIAIGLLLRQGYLLTKKRSIEMYRAVVYVAIAIDLFATMLILPLKFTSYDWHESQLIQYVQYLRLSIFLSTSIILHVKLRRFIVA
jgi:hypothetical protein